MIYDTNGYVCKGSHRYVCNVYARHITKKDAIYGGYNRKAAETSEDVITIIMRYKVKAFLSQL